MIMMMIIAIVVKINVNNNIIRKKAFMIMGIIVIKVISMVMMKTIIVMQW